jgi:hypothetical protein
MQFVLKLSLIKTLSRDQNVLVNMRLVVVEGRTVLANWHRILAFLPWRALNDESKSK